MKVWALTGGIASGKSTIADMFAVHGIDVLNADRTYHGLLAPTGGRPSALAQQVAAAFGEVAVLRGDGSVDRATLGAHIFADRAARLRLEAVTHPAIAAATTAHLARLRQAGRQHALYDVPLLFEKNLAHAFSGIVVVWVAYPVQVERLVARDKLTPEAAGQRLAAQLDLEQKRQRATWVVDNNGTLEASATQVASIWQQMQQH